ncbi:hypothetical protein K469DRAFT_67438 [Zopfia rhizophila CBS 207.26]|uniref:Secreted protein n=1 Tax=Zopfia rhizophila CBS 207.26 TaxID=1314779 RepID=A0A6A6DAV7_9PEZI|nr:hypothetical protein K469DRAFT_67438 [Zopfia rhizophila CBS 207.26]
MCIYFGRYHLLSIFLLIAIHHVNCPPTCPPSGYEPGVALKILPCFGLPVWLRDSHFVNLFLPACLPACLPAHLPLSLHAIYSHVDNTATSNPAVLYNLAALLLILFVDPHFPLVNSDTAYLDWYLSAKTRPLPSCLTYMLEDG